MSTFFFASDLHGSPHRYETLFTRLIDETPAALLLGGDLAPHAMAVESDRFMTAVLGEGLRGVKARLGDHAPRVLAILGNDDPGYLVTDLEALEAEGLLEHIHMKRTMLGPVPIYGCAWTPPTPFRLKDWERFDVGRGVDPGCLSPEQGSRSLPVDDHIIRYSTIASELQDLTGDDPLESSVMLFHSPPYDTAVDRAALDGRMVEHVPLDVHIGSIAVRRFLEQRRPAVALCGHVHESPRITGAWHDRIGRTEILSAAHDGPELALVRFDPEHPADATRELL